MNVRVLLKDIVSFSKGEQINGEDLIVDGTYPYLNGGIQPSGRWTACNTPENTITISEGGNSCGYVNLMTEPFWCGAHCYYLYDLSVDVQYLYYALKSQQARLMGIRSGACMPNIKKNDLGCFELTIHTENVEQRRIVEQLRLCQSLIEQRQHQLRAFDTLIKARFVEMFGDVKQEDTLLNLCNIIDYRGKTPEKVEDGLPFITAKNVRMHQLSIEPREYISKETYDSVMTRGFPREGDVVFTTEAPLGNVCRLPHFDTEFYVGQRIVTFQTERLAPAYLEYALDTDEFRRKVEGKSSGSTVTGIRVRLLEQLTIPVPNRASQEQFAAFVSQVDKSKAAVQAALDKAQLLFDSLMQTYFS